MIFKIISINFHQIVAVEDIVEIRMGQETDGFKRSKVKNKYPKDNSFSLIVKSERHPLNLVASTADIAKSWVHGLRWAKKKAQNIDVREKQALYPLIVELLSRRSLVYYYYYYYYLTCATHVI